MISSVHFPLSQPKDLPSIFKNLQRASIKSKQVFLDFCTIRSYMTFLQKLAQQVHMKDVYVTLDVGAAMINYKML